MAKEKEAKKKVKRPTAQKRILQSEKKRLQNKAFRSKVNTAVRTLEKAPTKESLSAVYSLMDKGVKTGVYNQNKASRVKSRLSARLPSA